MYLGSKLRLGQGSTPRPSGGANSASRDRWPDTLEGSQGREVTPLFKLRLLASMQLKRNVLAMPAPAFWSVNIQRLGYLTVAVPG
jgi:hypothetical protein